MFSSLTSDRWITAWYENNLATESLKKEREKQEEQKLLLKTLEQQQWVENWTPLVVALCESSKNTIYETLWNNTTELEEWKTQLITTIFDPENFTEQLSNADNLMYKNPHYWQIMTIARETKIPDIELLRAVCSVNTAMMSWKNFDNTQSANQKIQNRKDIVNTAIDTWKETIDQQELKNKWAVCLEKAAASVYRLNKQWIDADIVYGKLNDEWHAAVSLRYNGQSLLFDVTNPIQTDFWYIPSIESNNTARDDNPTTAVTKNNLAMTKNKY